MSRENVKTFSRWIIGCKDKDGAKEFLQESFQPPADAIEATNEMRERAPATVSIATGQGREIAYATLWDSGVDYFPPARWPVGSPWPERLPMPRGRYSIRSVSNDGAR